MFSCGRLGLMGKVAQARLGACRVGGGGGGGGGRIAGLARVAFGCHCHLTPPLPKRHFGQGRGGVERRQLNYRLKPGAMVFISPYGPGNMQVGRPAGKANLQMGDWYGVYLAWEIWCLKLAAQLNYAKSAHSSQRACRILESGLFQ